MGALRMITEGGRELVSANEAAAVLGVSRARVYDLLRTGIIPSVRLGRSVRISVAELDWLIKSGGKPLPGDQPPQGGANGK